MFLLNNTYDSENAHSGQTLYFPVLKYFLCARAETLVNTV